MEQLHAYTPNDTLTQIDIARNLALPLGLWLLYLSGTTWFTKLV
jgi:hypothetical protein